MTKTQNLSTQLILVIILLFLTAATAACNGNQAQQPSPEPGGAGGSGPEGQAGPGLEAPYAIITSPEAGRQFQQGQPVEVLAGALDEQGIARMELLVDERVVDSTEITPAPGAVFATRLTWLPDRPPGSYSLQVRAYNPASQVVQSEAIVIQVIPAIAALTGDTPTPTATAGPTERSTPAVPLTDTPLPPTATATPAATATAAAPYLVVSVQSGLNVREGPSTRYRALGRLEPGDRIDILGQGTIGAGRWWQIRFPSAAGGLGWVSASPDFSAAFNTENVESVAAPATPTPAPSTPTPTPIPTAQQARINFGADRTQIRAGECVTFFWDVTNVKEVYFNGVGVAGQSQARRECPGSTTFYDLRVVNHDGSSETRTIKIDVEGQAFSQIEMDIGESVDFDRDGRVSDDGDDFIWVEEDGDREFKKWDGDDDLKLVPVGPVDSLNVIRREDCEWALDHLDDKDSIDPFGGLAACIRTDEGRIGKIRFQNSREEVDIEWLLWQ